MLRSKTSPSYLALAALLTVAKLWLMRGQPIFAIGGAGFDDRLFLQLAENLRHGQWLGAYTDLTLAKGPGYPIWIALVNWGHLPLHLSEGVLYAVACLALVASLGPILPSRLGRLLFYLALLWNPMSYEAPVLGRVIRQTLYTPLTMLVLAGLLALVLRPTGPLKRRVGWGLLTGFSFAAFWLTREEGAWILPAAALLVALAGGSAWRARALGSQARVFGCAAAAAGLPILAVCLLNLNYYGWFGTVEFKAKDFKDAYGAMLRVESPVEVPYTPVTAETRALIYPVSPAFAELKTFIEGPRGRQAADGNGWLTHRVGRDMEIAGGWFMWIFRDAVQENGHCASAAMALAYYRRLADEINAACDRGLLPAGPKRSGMFPKWYKGETSAFLTALGRFGVFFISFQKFDPQPLPSEGETGLLYLFHDMTNERLMPSPDATDYVWARSFHGDADKVAILRGVGGLMGRVLYGLAILALLLVPVRVIQGLVEGTWTPVFPLALAVLAACACTVGVNALVEVSSFPNTSVGALAQGYPLLILFIGLMGIEVAQAVAARRR